MIELVIIIAAIALGSFVKGVTGTGLPQIAIPVMATFIGVERAVVIMAIPGIVANTWLMWTHREHYRATRDLPVMLVTGTIGAVLGTWSLKELDGSVLSLTLAGIIAVYVVLVLTRPTFQFSRGVTRYASPPVGLAAGALQGATGISGPLLSTYMHGYRLDKHVYVVSIVTLFQVFSVVQTVTLAAVGLYTPSRLTESVLALVPMALVLPLGTRLSQRLSSRAFDRLVLAILVATAGKLAFDALG